MKKTHTILTAVLALLTALSLTACNANALKYGSSEVSLLSDTDYSDMNNWLSFGGDMSKDVDVFMVYPSVTMRVDEADRIAAFKP